MKSFTRWKTISIIIEYDLDLQPSRSFRSFLDLNIRLFLDLRKFRFFLDLRKKQVRSPQVPLVSRSQHPSFGSFRSEPSRFQSVDPVQQKEHSDVVFLSQILGNQILHMWELSPALTAASLPPCASTAPEVRENANNGCFLSLL
ncbi:hypothetical protein L1987_51678 [Smallanthus sonchifolius]|uniref:Uncharacterized protein n=1 Tax=Smallanthus sonchifolius TaxID=185202 RepID=A0ACB9ERB3_9ASTR|nr:hypothetical protein L1987_51678 [Smallanthus sonchifolius]